MFIDERPAPSTPVACTTCGVQVLVRKNTYEQTVVQWPGGEDSSAGCRRADVADTTSLRRGCPALRTSIEDAVLRGDLAVEDLRPPGGHDPDEAAERRPSH